MTLSRLIRSKGFTNVAIAEYIGVHVVTMSNWSKNIEMMPFCKAVALARKIGLSVDELIEELSL